MRTVKVTLNQSFEVVKENETNETVIHLNGATFEVDNLIDINYKTLAYSFVNSLFTRFEAKEKGVKLPFAISKPINLLIHIDGKLFFNLERFAASSGYQIKFPAHLARKDKNAARKQLAEAFEYAVNAGTVFSKDIQAAFVTEEI